MNINTWRSAIIDSNWRTPDVDNVSIALAARFNSCQSTSIWIPCKEGIGLDIDCDRQNDALELLEQHSLVKLHKGGVTDGCCFRYDRIELLHLRE